MQRPDEARERIESLRGVIRHHSYAYYTLDNPSIPDHEYDQLFQELIDLEIQFPQVSIRILTDTKSRQQGSGCVCRCASRGADAVLE